MSGLGFFNCEAKGTISKLLCYKESKLHGMGLFATTTISANTDLHITHIHSRSIKNYSGPCDWINIIPNCMFNHSETNCNCTIKTEKRGTEDDRTKHLVTTKDIREGEELLFDYTTDEDLEQPEKDWLV